MDYENAVTLTAVEGDLVKWAERDEGGEDRPTCFHNWKFDEDQLRIIRAACANPYAAAIIAHVMSFVTDEEGLTIIAEVLGNY